MSDLDRSPSVSKTAFECPHCGAFTTQHWYGLLAVPKSGKVRTPRIYSAARLEEIQQDVEIPRETKEWFQEWGKKSLSGKPFFEINSDDHYSRSLVDNLNISKCYNCGGISVWVHDRTVYPPTRFDIKPNGDLPEKVTQLFDEAREIVDASPRGAAALLRLCVQYLCIELGQTGKNIDNDIANLVQEGLSPTVQQSLDIVRVVGNEAVHPGEIELNDSREIAVGLFGLINLICEQMISHPKQVEHLYGNLPKGKIEAIEKRDGRDGSKKS